MLIACDNRGCLKSSTALLDPKTNTVVCQECKQLISNISEPMKRALKSFGQVMREEKKAFMLGCKSCRANREVILDTNNQTVCKICGSPMNVPTSFRLAMEESGALKKINTDGIK